MDNEFSWKTKTSNPDDNNIMFILVMETCQFIP